MSPDLTLVQWMAILASVVTLHVGMVVARNKINPLYVLATVIMVLAPFSLAPDLALGPIVKWVRGYSLVLLLLLAVLRPRKGALGAATVAWLLFVALYVCAAFWSNEPHLAFLKKIQTGLTALAGVALALGIKDRGELIRGLRVMCIGGCLLGSAVLVAFTANAENMLQFGRANILGVLPTRLAINLVPFLLISIYLALRERAAAWRLFAYGASGVLASCLLITGSRGPVGAVLMALTALLLSGGQRRLRVLLFPIFVAGAAIVFLESFGSLVNVERLVSTADTRSGIWTIGWEQIKRAPLVGSGWVNLEGSTRNMHSVFMQAAVEVGLLGLAALCATLLVIAHRAFGMYRLVRRCPAHADLAILPVSIMVAAFFHALIESSAIGASSIAMLLAFAIGLVDFLPTLAIQGQQRMARRAQYVLARLRLANGGEPGNLESTT